MKKTVVFFMGFMSYTLFCITAQAAVFDDFSEAEIDLTKWHIGEHAVTVEDGKLLLQTRTAGETFQQSVIAFQNVPRKITAKVTVNGELSSTIANGDNLAGGLNGTFYRTMDDRNINALIAVLCNAPLTDANACKVHYQVVNGNDFSVINEGDFSPTFAVGTETTIGLEFDGAHTFTFSMAGQTDVTIAGPDEGASPPDPNNVFLQGSVSSTPPANGMAKVYFDDVTASGGSLPAPISDSFDQPMLDSDIWEPNRSNISIWGKRLITDGSMELSLHNVGINSTHITNRLQREHVTDFFQADLTMDSNSSMSGTTSDDRLEILIEGWYFNSIYDGTGYNGDEGEGAVTLRLEQRGSGSPLRVAASIFSCIDVDCMETTPESIYEILGCDVQLDTPVRLSIERKDQQFTFTCNKSTQQTITSPFTMYDSQHGDNRRVRARARTSDATEETYIEAYVDNVYNSNATSMTIYLPAILSGAQQQ